MPTATTVPGEPNDAGCCRIAMRRRGAATLEATGSNVSCPDPHGRRLTGRLLGAQIVANKGSTKRIDTAATALWNHMTVEEMTALDLAYAPPFSLPEVMVTGAAHPGRPGLPR
jgi:Pyridine nucleotide-disulphide oxidoreductase, dimerisation domain